MTPDQIRKAWKLRNEDGFSFRRIAEAIGGTSSKSVRLTLGRKAACVGRVKRKEETHRVIKRANMQVPQEVLDEAERSYQARMQEDLTTGQMYLGDPMPGRSALDRKEKDRFT